MIELQCHNCGDTYYRQPAQYKRRGSRYCSRLCQNTAQGKIQAELKHSVALLRSDALEQPSDCKLVALNRGGVVAIVDNMDYVIARTYAWTLHTQGYAISGHLYLHRLVLSRQLGRPLTRKDVCDHINHDKLDCRRSNIRLASASQNSANMKLPRHNTSGYKGVRRITMRGKPWWYASIKVEQKQIFIGLYLDKEDAAYGYDQFSMQLFGEFALTNFEYV